jgi:hypothetical protein
LRPEPNQVREYIIPKPDTSELLSATIPFIDGRRITNLKVALSDIYNNLVKRLFWQIVIAGTVSIIITLILRVFIPFPGNIVLSTLFMPTITFGVLWFNWEYRKELKRWQSNVKWLPEDKRIKVANIFRILYILAQVTLLTTGLASCFLVK